MNIIILDNEERFIHFLNPNLVDIVETFENGLRSIDVTYNIEEFSDAKRYFRQGRKIFITNTEENRLTECLYVLNTKVEQDLFDENQFSFKAEEVLVELNYAPPFIQSELSNKAFTTSQKNGETAVTVNWNSLNYWFGEYFNIGIVQDCISTYISKITFSGSMSLMSLLRYIEEETGNVFVTRYEKDITDNVIHRYLDFLNPTNQNKNWSCYFEYDFIAAPEPCVIDDEGNPVDDDDEYEEYDDDVEVPTHPIITNIDPAKLAFRITNDGEVICTEGTNPKTLYWTASSVGITSESEKIAVQIKYTGSKVGIKVHNKSVNIPDESTAGGTEEKQYITTIADDPDYIDDDVTLPNGCCFEFYNTEKERVVYSRPLYPILSESRIEVLDLGFNVENISFDIDESDTFTAIAPVLSLSKNESSNALSSSDMNKLVKAWRDLTVKKGDIIPMVVEKITVTGTDAVPCVQRVGIAPSTGKSAEQILGTYSVDKNYFTRPYKPTDNTEERNKSFEYWKGTAYWRAPFSKGKGRFYVDLDDNGAIEYTDIRTRPDRRGSRSIGVTPKCGQVETSEENIYAIYNAVAMKLKEKKDPSFNITVDVANYREGLFNDYNIHDRVYVKLPDSSELVTAKVIKTVKSLHDISENKIVLDNYSINHKEITAETYIDAENISFKYPKSKKLTVTLKNSENEDVKLANKIVTFKLYRIENKASTFTNKVYTKKTDKDGKCSLTCKYNPGDYEMQISFGGDAEYSESSTTVQINVSGVIKTKKTNTNKKTTATKYKNVKRYWGKDGVSPDKKYVKGVGRPSSAGEVSKYKYIFWETEVENYCPGCNRKGGIQYDIFFAGNETTDYGYSKIFGRGEGSSAEGLFHCKHCDRDWSVFGKEHGYDNTKLKIHKKSVKSSKSRAYSLRKGKLLYDTKKVKIKQKKVKNTKKRIVKGNPSKKVRKQALAIVGDLTGRAAMLEICKWVDRNISYAGYNGFCRSPDTVLSRGSCNCCDGTRLILELFDAAGLTEYYDLYYVRVPGHVYAQIRTKKSGHRAYIDTASTVPCYGYVCQGYTHGSPSSTYPNKPFDCCC